MIRTRVLARSPGQPAPKNRQAIPLHLPVDISKYLSGFAVVSSGAYPDTQIRVGPCFLESHSELLVTFSAEHHNRSASVLDFLVNQRIVEPRKMRLKSRFHIANFLIQPNTPYAGEHIVFGLLDTFKRLLFAIACPKCAYPQTKRQ